KRSAANAKPLKRTEKEELVFAEGAAKGATKLVAHKIALGLAVCLVIEGLRRKTCSPIELISTAAEVVGATLCDHIRHDRVSAEFRRRAVALNLKFLDSIEGHCLANTGYESVIVLATIKHEIDRRGACAPD